MNQDTIRDINAAQQRALIVGVVGLLVAAAGALFGLEMMFRSMLVGFLFAAGLGLGCLALMVLHQLTGGAWGLLSRRVMEAGARTMPVVALLFLPVVLGTLSGALYEWTHADVVAADPLLQHKQPYLNIPFFLLRSALYFVLWIAIAWRMSGWARDYDRSGDAALDARLRGMGGASMLLLFLTITFAAFDWIMTLEPHWFSSIFGAAVGSGWALLTFAFLVLMVRWLAAHSPRVAEVFSPPVLSDIGSLMMAFTLIWAYMNFSQFILIYAGNLPEEVTWFLHRSEGGWQWLSIALMALHFALPFAVLMGQGVRRNPARLASVATLLMVMNALYLMWLVRPAYPESQTMIGLHLLFDAAAIVGMGGLWLWAFFWQLKQVPLVPERAVAVLQERAHAH